MMNKMKKSFVLALGVALCLVFAVTASAIDNTSLENRTTEGLYDRTDPFDVALAPGFLYKIDRWRLYTNLSGYEEGESFLIGTSGKLGAGSLAFFYETNKYERDEADSYASYYYREYSTAPAVYPNYDGTYDYRWDDADWDKYEYKSEEDNLHVAYSIDLGRVSLGLGYAPEFEKNERTVAYSGTLPDTDDPATLWDSEWFWNMNLFPGWGSGSTSSWISYDPSDHTTYWRGTDSESFSGKLNTDRTEHPFKVQSHIRFDDADLLVGVGYASIEEEDDLSAVFRSSSVSEDTGGIGQLETFDASISVNGSLDEDYEGDEWSIYVSPTFKVNDMVSVRADLGYSKEDGDFTGGRVAILDATETDRAVTLADTETWTWSETWNGSSKGDFEDESWGIEPRVYLTFDKVRFSLGVGYTYSKEEWNGTERGDKSVRYTYDDGDGVADADDWTFVGSWTGYENFDGEEETMSWRFPVATEFDVTEKLTFRAGAAYYRVRTEYKDTSTEVGRENENYTQTDGTGTVVAVGPEAYRATAAADPVAYDADAHGSSETETEDLTSDFTTYHLGLGYTFTENLKCDLMWTGKGAGGGVDMTEVFASVTLAF